MRKLLKTSILVFAFCFCAFAQSSNNKPCPTISISTPSGYLGRDENLTITADIENSAWDKLIYNWKISGDISIEGQGTPIISFIAKEDMNYSNIDISVEVKGFTDSCKNTASKSFQILFNPRSPLVLDEYEKLLPKDEKVRLSIVASKLKENPNFMGLFIINFTKNDSYSNIKKRVVDITSVLTKTFGTAKEKFQFVFFENTDYRTTRIYLIPKDSYPFWDGEKDLEKLRPQNKIPKTKNK